jgi:hypothetical protein
MFAIDAASEALFEKGYPHLRVLEAGHPHEKDAATWALKALRIYDPDVYFVRWPQEVAYRFVRAMGAKRVKGPANNICSPDAKDEERLAQVSGPVTVKEAKAIVEQLTHNQSIHRDANVENALLLLEAMVGGELVVDTALARYEKFSAKDLAFGNPHDVTEVAYTLGHLLRRLPAPAAKKARARMEAFVAKKPASSVRERFQMVVGGVQGIEDSGWAKGIHIAHFVDDPAFILEHADTGGDTLDMAIAYRAGPNAEKVLAVFEKRLKRVEAWRLPWLVEELSRVASPRALAMLKALTAKKPVAEAAKAALAARTGKKVAPAAAAKPVNRKKLEADAEKRFEELSAWTAKQLRAAKGVAKKEAAVLEEAVNRYADIRTDLGEPAEENVVHFFGADGVGYGKHREPAFLRAKPSDAELKRWLALIS